MSNPLTVAAAREMGFDDAQIEDLIDQGLVSEARPLTWRPETLADLNWLVSKSRSYDAEEARIDAQYQRRKKALAQRRTWLARYDQDCAAILADALPKKADGSYRKKSLDLEDGRVKLKQTGGGLVVDEAKFLAFAHEADTRFAPELFSAVRVTKQITETGEVACDLIGSEGWKPSVLKTPLAVYLDAHPDATLPGVSVAPISQVFEIERLKAETGGAA